MKKYQRILSAVPAALGLLTCAPLAQAGAYDSHVPYAAAKIYLPVNLEDEKDKKISELNDEIKVLQAENRKLALALADAAQDLVRTEGSGAARRQLNGAESAEIEALKNQNDALQNTIRAQNEILAAAGDSDDVLDVFSKQKAEILALKETIKTLQSQNNHLASAGGLGETAAQQMIAAQEKVLLLQAELQKEQENSQTYRQKIREYELRAAEDNRAGNGGDNKSLSKKERDKIRKEYEETIVKLELENQELKARLELANAGQKHQVNQNLLEDNLSKIEPAAAKDSAEKKKAKEKMKSNQKQK